MSQQHVDDRTAVLFKLVTPNIALVTINRPEAKNALNPEVLVRLYRHWSEIDKNDAIRVVILTGTGDTFCSGADLGRLIPLLSGARGVEDEWDKIVNDDPTILTKAMFRDSSVLGKPVIAAINGSAIAGGLEIVQGTQLRVSWEGARFGLQEPKWGLFPIGGSTVRLPRQLPYAIAMEVLLTGNLFDAKKALQYGMVNYVVSNREDVIPKAIELAKAIADNSPHAVRAINKSVKECSGLPEKEAMDKENEVGMPVFAHPDAREGPRAFKEKRKPVWKANL